MELYLDNLSSYGSLHGTTARANQNTAMQSGKKAIVNCRLCLLEIPDSNVTLLEGIISDMLEIILPELNLSICYTSSICKSCLETLKQAYNFKSSCLEVEDKVQDFVNPKKLTVIDLKEVLKKTNDMKQISGNLIVCRTCLGLGQESLYTKLCSYEGDPLQNMVEKCLPEMGLNLTKDPAICPMCLEQLEEQFHFIMQCHDTEAKINFYSERQQVFKDVDLQKVYLFSICMEEQEDVERHYGTVENGNFDRGPTSKPEEISKNQSVHNIKREDAIIDCVDLTEDLFSPHIKNKMETFDHILENDAEPNLKNLKSQSFGHASHKPPEEVTFHISKDGEDIIVSKTSAIKQDDGDSDSGSDISVTRESDLLTVRKVMPTSGISQKTRSDKKQPEKQPKPVPQREYKEDNEAEESEEEFNKKRTRMRKCKICDFKTKFGSRMKAHMTVYHSVKVTNGESEEKTFKCRHCTFKTPNESTYKEHKLQHRKEKEQKCPHCTMVFVRPDFLKKHVESHGALKVNNVNVSKKPSPKLPEVAARETPKKRKLIKTPQATNFNMKYTFSFHGQVLKMFKCRYCPYQTRLKSNYEKHVLTHKKTTEIKTHRCKICNFETIQKENFLTHMQGHENEGDNKVMRCFLCSFQPATELALKQHVNQVHKSGTG